MITTTARAIIARSLKMIGVLGDGTTVTAEQERDALIVLNALVDALGTQPQSMYAVTRTVTTCASGAASYSIGDTSPASDFDQVRPLWIQSAAYLDPNSSDPSIEVPIPVLSDQMYQAQQVKDLTNTLPTTLYYQPTSGQAGTIILWPVLTQDVDIVLYVPEYIAQFGNPATEVVLPTGYARMFHYNLAKELIPEYGQVDPRVVPAILEGAAKSLADVKRANVRPSDLSVDAGIVSNPSAGWNIFTGP